MTSQEQIEVLERSKEYDIIVAGLCYSIDLALCYFGVDIEEYEEIKKYISLFNFNNAKKFNANGADGWYWWYCLNAWKHRNAFREWIIKELKKEL